MTTTPLQLPPVTNDWQDEALCREVGADLFFPTGSADQIREITEQAKEVCFLCPVRLNCLSWAIAQGETDEGVFGGMSPAERRGFRRRQGRHIADARRAEGETEWAALLLLETHKEKLIAWHAEGVLLKRIVGRLGSERVKAHGKTEGAPGRDVLRAAYSFLGLELSKDQDPYGDPNHRPSPAADRVRDHWGVVEEMLSTGASAGKIAAEVGVSERTVRHVLSLRDRQALDVASEMVEAA